MPSLSIFTPTHNPQWLPEVYASIKDQPFDEWVILFNNKAKCEDFGFIDPRIKCWEVPEPNAKIGWLKNYAVSKCNSNIIVELDHDDLLMPGAIEKIKKAFNDSSVGFVYSNCLYTDMYYGKRQKFNPAYGWQYRDVDYNGHMLDEPLSFPPTPASVSRIWYAPDHVRAFRISVYNEVGGYDPTLNVLDDQDLMCRMYQITKFKHIDEPLYIYRVYGYNSWLQRNQEIQNGVYPMYDKYIEGMALRWSKNLGLKSLDLGGRFNKDDRYISVDEYDAQVEANLEFRWPFKDNSVGVIRANDILEHLKSPLFTMKEIYRVLAPGGYAFIQVPSTDGRGAFQDPTHKSFWNENSFLYYTDRRWAQYIDTPVRFQVLRLYTTQPDENKVTWVRAHLLKITDSLVNTRKIPGIMSI